MSRVVRFVAVAVFERTARKLFSATDLAALRSKLADNPEAGDMIPGTGGARKVRHHGKRGASRVIYYFHLGRRWLFLLDAYAKGAQENLTQREIKWLSEIVASIKQELKP